MKFFLKADHQKDYDEVTKEQYIKAEKNAGFCSKFGEDCIATAAFRGHGMNGKVEYEDD